MEQLYEHAVELVCALYKNTEQMYRCFMCINRWHVGTLYIALLL